MWGGSSASNSELTAMDDIVALCYRYPIEYHVFHECAVIEQMGLTSAGHIERWQQMCPPLHLGIAEQVLTFRVFDFSDIPKFVYVESMAANIVFRVSIYMFFVTFITVLFFL